jgi:hypothetical protein
MLLLGVSAGVWSNPGALQRAIQALLLPPNTLFSMQFQMSLLRWPDPLVLAHHHGGVTVTRIQIELLLLVGCMRCCC